MRAGCQRGGSIRESEALAGPAEPWTRLKQGVRELFLARGALGRIHTTTRDIKLGAASLCRAITCVLCVVSYHANSPTTPLAVLSLLLFSRHTPAPGVPNGPGPAQIAVPAALGEVFSPPANSASGGRAAPGRSDQRATTHNQRPHPFFLICTSFSLDGRRARPQSDRVSPAARGQL